MARDPEFWEPRPPVPGAQGRPRVYVERHYLDYPAPNPQETWCKIWCGALDRDGYGILSGRGKGTSNNNHKRIRAHRWVWEMANGPIPPGMVVRHKCDNRPCYRLTHLELGTVAENNQDAAERGHLGPARIIPPSQVLAIVERREAGETWTSIHADYQQYSLATVKRVRRSWLEDGGTYADPDG